jgi:hypothetical protein
MNQYRGTIVLESPTPFTVPHIIINEPPPQDPWIPWYNATPNPQDHGYGQYLIVPHRLVYQVHVPTDDDDDDGDAADGFYSSMSPTHAEEEEESDFSCQDDDFISGSFSSSSSESEPETPDPDSLMDEFLLEDDDDEEEEDHVHLFDSCDDSPWSGIINRFSAKASVTAAAATFVTSVVAYDESEEEDELPPFDDWYQSIAARTLVTMTA